MIQESSKRIQQYALNPSINLNDPEVRYSLAQEYGLEAFDILMTVARQTQHFSLETYLILPIDSDNGRLYSIRNTDKTFRTLEEAQNYTRELEEIGTRMKSNDNWLKSKLPILIILVLGFLFGISILSSAPKDNLWLRIPALSVAGLSGLSLLLHFVSWLLKFFVSKSLKPRNML
ncbi:MAG: hypothetical protein FWG02_03625 [Holophagaceae bacterium]|nr:hypothetical protein [Holophagaceae bacterium]